MKHKFRYVVPPELLLDAIRIWRIQHGKFYSFGKNEEKEFFEYMGIPYKDIVEYNESWKLVVSQATYKKLEILASDNPHQETLFKIIEARYGKSST